jgi:vacuolar-type H+-ATPase subunit I/STV1
MQYTAEGQEANNSHYLVEAQSFVQKAEQLEAENNALEPKKVEIQARVAELKTERETINRETVERTLAIDKELARLQGSMTI